MLLPPRLEALRSRVPIVDSLPAKGYPRRQRPTAALPLRTVAHIYDRTEVLAHIGLGADEAYALTDKSAPHALHEIMMISAGQTRRPGLHDHSATFGRALGALAVCFAEHCAGRGLYPIVSWSYDPETGDRPSIQGEERFHAHLVGRTAAERATVAANTIPAAKLPPTRRRRIVEEASILGALLLADCIEPAVLQVLEPVPVLSTPAAMVASSYRLPHSWTTFTDPALYNDLLYLHRALDWVYREITRACTVGESGLWKRPKLDPKRAGDIRLPLSRRTRETLDHYLASLRPEVLDGVSASASRSRVIHCYPLASLAYAVSFAEHRGHLYGHVRANVFSDLGGAGVTFIDGTIVKIRKAAGVFTLGEVAARVAFQREYLRRLRHHPSAGFALFPRQQGEASVEEDCHLRPARFRQDHHGQRPRRTA